MMASATIQLFSEDPTLIESVQAALRTLRHCRLQVAAIPDEPFEVLRRQELDLLVFHARDDRSDGLLHQLLQQIATEKLLLPTLAISDEHAPGKALQLLRAGAADALSRPLDLSRLAFLVETLTLRLRFPHALPAESAAQAAADPAPEPAARPARPATTGSADAPDLHDLFGCSSSRTAAIAGRLRKVAAHDITVLLVGETGVGKTRMAQRIHAMSPRAPEPFLVVNCAALPETLLESELFGHRKGSFTGADADRVGKFAAAGRGTLLLDEIDSLPLASQAKLLRVVDERVFEPIGGNASQQCAARLIVATNRPLEAEVEAGRFRSDLYYRFNAASFRLPPLRERPAAIATIAERFLEEFAARAGLTPPHLSSHALELLQRYPWPGNVRELRNAMERALALCTDELITAEDLPEAILQPSLQSRPSGLGGAPSSSAPGSPPPWPRSAEAAEETAESRLRRLNPRLSELAVARGQAEMAHLLKVLDRCNNNRSHAAQELGISRTALYKKLNKFGL